MTLRRQARLDAAAALLDAGWSAERIALALGIARTSVARLIPAPLTPEPPAWLDSGSCLHIDRLGYYCDSPVRWPGEVYCDIHRPQVWS